MTQYFRVNRYHQAAKRRKKNARTCDMSCSPRKREKGVHSLSSFDDLKSWVLVVIGVFCFLLAGFLGMILTDQMRGMIRAFDEVGIDGYVAVITIVVSMCLGAAMWFSGCVAARCHAVLYRRWFP